MTLQEFKQSLQQATMPTDLSTALQALWQAGKGDWNAAHAITQAQGDADVDWVHAYLHREEGDLNNAGYWYRRAGRPPLARRPGEPQRQGLAVGPVWGESGHRPHRQRSGPGAGAKGTAEAAHRR